MSSELWIAALAALLTPQAAPGPPPEPAARAVRPFEPGPDFGRQIAEGDGAGRTHRPPLTAPVTVDAYDGAYEFAPTDAEIAYDQGVASAEIRADQGAGPLDRDWVIRDAEGRILYEIVLMDSGTGPAEGGWRSGRRTGGAAAVDGVLRLDDGATVVLERDGAGWRGRLDRDGRSREVSLTRPG